MSNRTTITLPSDLLASLKVIVVHEKVKSLSRLIQNITREFIDTYKGKRQREKLKMNYQQYAKLHRHSNSESMENAALHDLAQRL